MKRYKGRMIECVRFRPFEDRVGVLLLDPQMPAGRMFAVSDILMALEAGC